MLKQAFSLIKYSFTVIFCLIFCAACNFDGTKSLDIEPRKSQMSLWAELFDGFDGQSATVSSSRSIAKGIQWLHNVGDTTGFVYNPLTRVSVPVTNGFGALYDTVKGAKVSLYEDDKLLYDFYQNFPFYQRGVFFSRDTLKFIPNKTYKMVVSAPGFDTLVAREKAVSNAKMRGVRFQIGTAALPTIRGRLCELLIEIDDNPNEENFYAVDVISLVTYMVNVGGQMIPDERYFIQQLYPIDKNATNGKVISDRNFNGQRYTWRIGLFPSNGPYKFEPNSEIIVAFRSVSKGYEAYQRQLDLIANADSNPFAEPFKLKTNTEGGYGLFTISGVLDTLTIPLK